MQDTYRVFISSTSDDLEPFREAADLLLVMVAKRYGWVPKGGTKSITWLECESIELLGLELKEAHNVRLGQIYVPAVTEPRTEFKSREKPEFQRENKPALLLERLGKESIYVPGAPGAGKSVFCRWVACIPARP